MNFSPVFGLVTLIVLSEAVHELDTCAGCVVTGCVVTGLVVGLCVVTTGTSGGGLTHIPDLIPPLGVS